MRLLTWFFSTTDNPGAAPTHSVAEVLATTAQLRAEAFADYTTPGPKGSHVPLSVASPVPTNCPVLQAGSPPPLALPHD